MNATLARLTDGDLLYLAEVLARLAETFELAVKPLDHLANRYLLRMRDRLFDAR